MLADGSNMSLLWLLSHQALTSTTRRHPRVDVARVCLIMPSNQKGCPHGVHHDVTQLDLHPVQVTLLMPVALVQRESSSTWREDLTRPFVNKQKKLQEYSN